MTRTLVKGRYPWPLVSLVFLAFGQNGAVVFGQSDVKTARPLGANVNTPGDEFAPLRYADKIYFSSTKKDGQTGKRSTRSMAVVREEPAQLLTENPKDARLQMAHTALTAKSDRMYYTVFSDNSQGEMTEGQLWYRNRNYDGTWGNPVRLPRHLNLPGHPSMAPALGFDLALNKEVLFFVSDRPGGPGGLDVWCSIVTPGIGMAEDQFGEPFILPLNTEGDDVSPFFDTQSQVLFWGTNGRRGYGGFDIFNAKKQADGTWAMPMNLKEPINSEQDDRCFSIHQASGLAYFSSNRPNKNCSLPNLRNFDIYQADMMAELRVEIVDGTLQQPLTGCNVELLDPLTNLVEATLLDLPQPVATMDLTVDKPYRLIVSQPGFYPAFLDVLATNEQLFSVLEKKVVLKPMRQPVVQQVRGTD